MSKTVIILKKNIRIYISDATDVAQIAIDKHETLPLASLALSTAMAVYSSFGIMKKEIKSSINIKGNGPLKNIIIETDGLGNIKSLVGNPHVKTEFDNKNFNNIPLTLGVGDGGTLKIVHQTDKINFGGEVPLANGDITTDLAYYFDQSEQIYTAVISDVQLKTPKKLKSAKSVIFQMLPKHSEIDIRWVENFLNNNKLSKLSIDEYIKKIDGEILETIKINWKCNCSEEKMFSIYNTLPEKDKKELVEKYGHVEIICNFCKNKFHFK